MRTFAADSNCIFFQSSKMQNVIVFLHCIFSCQRCIKNCIVFVVSAPGWLAINRMTWIHGFASGISQMPIESKCLSRLYFFSRWFIALSARCALRQYLLSFFQLMDIIGTISMAFDISFLLGSKANEQDSQIIYGCNIEQTRTYETMSITFLLHQ